jgi:hypothetical protein
MKKPCTRWAASYISVGTVPIALRCKKRVSTLVSRPLSRISIHNCERHMGLKTMASGEVKQTCDLHFGGNSITHHVANQADEGQTGQFFAVKTKNGRIRWKYISRLAADHNIHHEFVLHLQFRVECDR